MHSGYVTANLKISEVVTFKIPASYNSFEINIHKKHMLYVGQNY